MFKPFVRLALLLASTAAPAQMMTVSGHILNASGTPLASGTVYFTPVSSTGVPMSFQMPGGQSVSKPVSATVSSGLWTLPLPDTSQTTPQNQCFKETSQDPQTGQQLIPNGYTCIQPSSTAYWCTSTTCNLDNYHPNQPSLAVVQVGPKGDKGDTGATGATGPAGTTSYNGSNGPFQTPSMNGGLQAQLYAGTGNHDIHDRANQAIASCNAGNAQHPNGCNVHIGAAPVPYTCWPVSTTLYPPISVHGSVAIYWDDGACENFYGTGYAVNAGGGPLPSIRLHLINPKITGVASPTSLDTPNTVSPGGILVGWFEGVTIDNPDVEGFQASPAQLTASQGSTQTLGAAGINLYQTDGTFLSAGELSGNWDNIRMFTNNAKVEFHQSGHLHRGIDAAQIGTGNEINVATDPPGGTAEEVVAYFGQGFSNTIIPRYAEGATSQLSGFVAGDGSRTYAGIVVNGGILNINNMNGSMTNLNEDVFVNNGAHVTINDPTDGDSGTSYFWNYGPDVSGNPQFVKVINYQGYGAPGPPSPAFPCVVLFSKDTVYRIGSTGCAEMGASAYATNAFVVSGLQAPNVNGTIHTTRPDDNGKFDAWYHNSTLLGYMDQSKFVYNDIQRSGGDPAQTDASGEVPSTAWTQARIANLIAAKTQLFAQALSVNSNSVNSNGQSECNGLNGGAANAVAPASVSNAALATQSALPPSKALVVSGMSFTVANDPGNGSTYTLTLFDNGSATAMSCTATGTGSNAVNGTSCSYSGSVTLASGHSGAWCFSSGTPNTSLPTATNYLKVSAAYSFQ